MQYRVDLGKEVLAVFSTWEEAEQYLLKTEEDLLEQGDTALISKLDIVEFELPKPKSTGRRYDDLDPRI